MCQQCSHSIPVGPVINRFFNILNELTLTVYLPFYRMLTLLHCSSHLMLNLLGLFSRRLFFMPSLYSLLRTGSNIIFNLCGFIMTFATSLTIKIHSLRKLCKRSPTTNNRVHLSATEYQLQCDIRKAKANYLVSNFAFSNDSNTSGVFLVRTNFPKSCFVTHSLRLLLLRKPISLINVFILSLVLIQTLHPSILPQFQIVLSALLVLLYRGHFLHPINP